MEVKVGDLIDTGIDFHEVIDVYKDSCLVRTGINLQETILFTEIKKIIRSEMYDCDKCKGPYITSDPKHYKYCANCMSKVQNLNLN